MKETVIILIITVQVIGSIGEDVTRTLDKLAQTSNIPEKAELKADDALKLFGQGLKSAGAKLGLITNQGFPEMLLKTLTNSLTKFPINSAYTNPASETIFNGFFRLLGFDAEKLQAIALNAIVFIAQMIGTNLTKKHSSKPDKGEATKYKFDYDFDDYDSEDEAETDNREKTGTPLEWVVKNAPENIKMIMLETQEKDLSEKLMKSAQSTSLRPKQETDPCLLHLLCRLEPVIKGMQESTRQLFGDAGHPKVSKEEWSKLTPGERMYAYLPKNEDFKRQKKYCDQKLPPCVRPEEK